mmetsp:Transcript_59936/g.140218  ORF Transcript_59936/g.140218 Transcript_59936/m.140218 type:complete len:235 (-) Transcript_59936:531-1235(-)
MCTSSQMPVRWPAAVPGSTEAVENSLFLWISTVVSWGIPASTSPVSTLAPGSSKIQALPRVRAMPTCCRWWISAAGWLSLVWKTVATCGTSEEKITLSGPSTFKTWPFVNEAFWPLRIGSPRMSSDHPKAGIAPGACTCGRHLRGLGPASRQKLPSRTRSSPSDAKWCPWPTCWKPKAPKAPARGDLEARKCKSQGQGRKEAPSGVGSLQTWRRGSGRSSWSSKSEKSCPWICL